MAKSLKAALPALARITGETPTALYGWQRAMAREGLLDYTPGRGPGSGTPNTPEAMAQFLIGICCQATRVENVPLAHALANARSADGQCPLTGAKRFADALASILSDASMAQRVNQVTMGITLCQARIRYDGAHGVPPPPPAPQLEFKSSVFVGKRASPRGLSFTATISGEMLVSIVKEVLT